MPLASPVPAGPNLFRTSLRDWHARWKVGQTTTTRPAAMQSHAAEKEFARPPWRRRRPDAR